MIPTSNQPTVVLQDKSAALRSFIEGEFPNSHVIFANSQNWNDVNLTAQRVIYVVHHTARFESVNFHPERFRSVLDKQPFAIRVIAATPGTPENATSAPAEIKVDDIAYQIETIWFQSGINEGRQGRTTFTVAQNIPLPDHDEEAPPSDGANPPLETDEDPFFLEVNWRPQAPRWNKSRYAAKAAMAFAGAAVVTFVALQMIAFLAPHYAAAHFTAPIQFLVTPLAKALSGQTFGLMAAKIGGGSLLGAGGLFAFGTGILLTVRQRQMNQS